MGTFTRGADGLFCRKEGWGTLFLTGVENTATMEELIEMAMSISMCIALEYIWAENQCYHIYSYFMEEAIICNLLLLEGICPACSQQHSLPYAEMNLIHADYLYIISVSSRISKGQGYQGFLRKRAGSGFGQKRAICVVQGKT
jgi:hypothetical protein